MLSGIHVPLPWTRVQLDSCPCRLHPRIICFLSFPVSPACQVCSNPFSPGFLWNCLCYAWLPPRFAWSPPRFAESPPRLEDPLPPHQRPHQRVLVVLDEEQPETLARFRSNRRKETNRIISSPCMENRHTKQGVPRTRELVSLDKSSRQRSPEE